MGRVARREGVKSLIPLSIDRERVTSSLLGPLLSSSSALDPEDEAIAFSEIESVSYTGVKSGAEDEDARFDRGLVV